MGEKVINAALLGLGTVGTGVYKVLKNQEEEMTAKIGCKVKIRKILVRNLEKAAGKVDDPAVLTNSWEDIKADPSIDIIIELISSQETHRLRQAQGQAAKLRPFRADNPQSKNGCQVRETPPEPTPAMYRLCVPHKERSAGSRHPRSDGSDTK